MFTPGWDEKLENNLIAPHWLKVFLQFSSENNLEIMFTTSLLNIN